jgi:hypothetical protein
MWLSPGDARRQQTGDDFTYHMNFRRIKPSELTVKWLTAIARLNVARALLPTLNARATAKMKTAAPVWRGR